MLKIIIVWEAGNVTVYMQYMNRNQFNLCPRFGSSANMHLAHCAKPTRTLLVERYLLILIPFFLCFRITMAPPLKYCPAQGCGFEAVPRLLNQHWRSLHERDILMFYCPFLRVVIRPRRSKAWSGIGSVHMGRQKLKVKNLRHSPRLWTWYATGISATLATANRCCRLDRCPQGVTPSTRRERWWSGWLAWWPPDPRCLRNVGWCAWSRHPLPPSQLQRTVFIQKNPSVGYLCSLAPSRLCPTWRKRSPQCRHSLSLFSLAPLPGGSPHHQHLPRLPPIAVREHPRPSPTILPHQHLTCLLHLLSAQSLPQSPLLQIRTLTGPGRPPHLPLVLPLQCSRPQSTQWDLRCSRVHLVATLHHPQEPLSFRFLLLPPGFDFRRMPSPPLPPREFSGTLLVLSVGVRGCWTGSGPLTRGARPLRSSVSLPSGIWLRWRARSSSRLRRSWSLLKSSAGSCGSVGSTGSHRGAPGGCGQWPAVAHHFKRHVSSSPYGIH